MELTQDFRELLELFNENKIRYLVVGGYAVNNYGYPRYTHDIDLWVWTDKKNAQRILHALNEFGFGGLNLFVQDFLDKNNIVQLGMPPNRVDILTAVDGVFFDRAYPNRNEVTIEELVIPFIGLNDLLRNKEASGRMQDLADAENLRNIHSIEEE